MSLDASHEHASNLHLCGIACCLFIHVVVVVARMYKAYTTTLQRFVTYKALKRPDICMLSAHCLRLHCTLQASCCCKLARHLRLKLLRLLSCRGGALLARCWTAPPSGSVCGMTVASTISTIADACMQDFSSVCLCRDLAQHSFGTCVCCRPDTPLSCDHVRPGCSAFLV